jgi:multicomponent Na+:H+ antiporter subunit C
MSVAYLVIIAVLFATGSYMLMHRSLTRITLGVVMLSNGINVLIVATSSRPGEPPIVGADGAITDPVPQALVLTAIVIGFAIVAFMLALVWRSWTLSGDDQVEDDVEDRRLASESTGNFKKSGSTHHEDVAT